MSPLKNVKVKFPLFCLKKPPKKSEKSIAADCLGLKLWREDELHPLLSFSSSQKHWAASSSRCMPWPLTSLVLVAYNVGDLRAYSTVLRKCEQIRTWVECLKWPSGSVLRAKIWGCDGTNTYLAWRFISVLHWLSFLSIFIILSLFTFSRLIKYL